MAERDGIDKGGDLQGSHRPAAADDRARPGQARSVQRQGQVLAAAIRLLLGGGSAGVTHRRVAEESGSSPGAVRYYYGSREDLLAACLEQIESARTKAAERILNTLSGARPDPQQTARWALEVYYGTGLDDESLAGTVWSVVDCARESPRLGTLLGRHRRSAQLQLEQLLAGCGYATVAPSLVTAVLDGSILQATLEGMPAVTGTAVAELTGILHLTSA